MTQIVTLADKPLGRTENPATLKRMRYSFAYEEQTSTAGVKEALHTPEEKESAIWITTTKPKDPWVIFGESAILIIEGQEVEPLSTEDILKQEKGFIDYAIPPDVVLNIGKPWASAIIGYGYPFFKLISGSPSGLSSTLEKCLEQLKQLPEGWDSYGACAISPTAIDRARSILVRVTAPEELGLSAPFVAPTSRGGVGLEWRFESGRELLLEVSPAGNVSYLLVIPKSDGGEEKIEDTVGSHEELETLFQSLCS